jgi:hypothetical protein
MIRIATIQKGGYRDYGIRFVPDSRSFVYIRG